MGDVDNLRGGETWSEPVRNLTEGDNILVDHLPPERTPQQRASIDAAVPRKWGLCDRMLLRMMRSIAVVLLCPYRNRRALGLGHHAIETPLDCQEARAISMAPIRGAEQNFVGDESTRTA